MPMAFNRLSSIICGTLSPFLIRTTDTSIFALQLFRSKLGWSKKYFQLFIGVALPSVINPLPLSFPTIFDLESFLQPSKTNITTNLIIVIYIRIFAVREITLLINTCCYFLAIPLSSTDYASQVIKAFHKFAIPPGHILYLVVFLFIFKSIYSIVSSKPFINTCSSSPRGRASPAKTRR